MIPARKLHQLIKRKLTGNDSAPNVDAAQIDDAIEEAIQIFVERLISNPEGNETIREHLRPIKKLGVKLKIRREGDELIAFLPNDYYRRSNIVFTAATSTCPEKKINVVYPQDKEYRLAKDDEFLGPSYRWGHTVAEDSSMGIHIAISNDMIPKKVLLDYYRLPVYVRYPEGAGDEDYLTAEGKKITENVGLELSNNFQIRPIIDYAVLILLLDKNDPTFQSRLSMISNLNKI